MQAGIGQVIQASWRAVADDGQQFQRVIGHYLLRDSAGKPDACHQVVLRFRPCQRLDSCLGTDTLVEPIELWIGELFFEFTLSGK